MLTSAFNADEPGNLATKERAIRGSTDQAVFAKFPKRSDAVLCKRGTVLTLQSEYITSKLDAHN